MIKVLFASKIYNTNYTFLQKNARNSTPKFSIVKSGDILLIEGSYDGDLLWFFFFN